MIQRSRRFFAVVDSSVLLRFLVGMADTSKTHSVKKGNLHPRNLHVGRYDFAELVDVYPDLERYARPNPKGELTVDFSEPAAVVSLNKALLARYYGITAWAIPEGYLCPPIPGRADAIHYLADLLAESNDGQVPKGKKVRVLDVGTGANCIYPIIGSQSYGWSMVGSEIDSVAVKAGEIIVQSNPGLKSLVKIVKQKDSESLFRGIIRGGDFFDLTMCNPPFFASLKEAEESNRLKWKKLGKGAKPRAAEKRNFGGQSGELWCKGGEKLFLNRMIEESVEFGDQVGWFTSLVSKSQYLPALKRSIEYFGAKQIRVIEMSQGQKISRLLAWSFAPAKGSK